MRRLFCATFIWAFVCVAQAPAQPIPRVHDPSTIAKCDGVYWTFCTGNGILSRYSTNLTNWLVGPPVFTNPPEWTTNAIPGNKGHLWAPDIILVSNTYYLYYSISTWGSRGSAIGLASNATLNPTAPSFCWRDGGMVVRTSDHDDYNAIDPSVFRDSDGSLWMAFGSYWSGIKLVRLNPETGKAAETNVYSLAYNKSIEAACLAKHGSYYYLFVNWGQCCRGMESTYEIRVGRSASITGPFCDRDGLDLMHGGGTHFATKTGHIIGPGHAGIYSEGTNDWVSFHFYDGNRSGAPTLAVRRLQWTADGWPTVKLE